MEKPDNITRNDWFLLEKIYQDQLDYLKEKLKEDYPIQYLIGYVDFCGNKINVDNRVLIPRFETEELVSRTIKKIHNLGIIKPKILDIGTGSGCIAIALAKELKEADITAIDISIEALSLARDNAELNNVKINFLEHNILTTPINEYFDIIISNPPYVSVNEPVDNNVKFEPSKAIFSEPSCLFYEKILQNINSDTKLIALEMGISQGEDIKLFSGKYFPGNEIEILNDLTNRPRYVFITKIE